MHFSGLLYPREFYAIFLAADLLTCLKSNNNPCQGTEDRVCGFKDNTSGSYLGYELFYSWPGLLLWLVFMWLWLLASYKCH